MEITVAFFHPLWEPSVALHLLEGQPVRFFWKVDILLFLERAGTKIKWYSKIAVHCPRASWNYVMMKWFAQIFTWTANCNHPCGEAHLARLKNKIKNDKKEYDQTNSVHECLNTWYHTVSPLFSASWPMLKYKSQEIGLLRDENNHDVVLVYSATHALLLKASSWNETKTCHSQLLLLV